MHLYKPIITMTKCDEITSRKIGVFVNHCSSCAVEHFIKTACIQFFRKYVVLFNIARYHRIDTSL